MPSRLDNRPTDRALAKAGFESYRDYLQQARGTYDPGFSVKLRTSKIPPNHPYVAQLAGALDLSPKRFTTIFSARAKPLPDRVLRGIASRAAAHPPTARAERRPPMTSMIEAEQEHASTNGHATEKLSRRGEHMQPDRPDHKLILDAGMTSVGELVMRAMGTVSPSGSFYAKVRTRAVAPNHPYLPRLADALGVSVERVIDAFSINVAPLHATIVKRLTSTAPGPRKAKRAARVPREDAIYANGKRHYNKLKSKNLGLRQSTRSIISTYIVAAMNGEKAITIPIDALYPFLQDYIELRHIKGAVLISPDFAEQFG